MRQGKSNRSFFMNIVDYFVYQNFKHDADLLYRSRILAGFSLVTIVLVTVTTLYLVLGARDLAGPGVSVGILLTSLLGLIFTCILFSLKKTANLSLAINLLLTSAWLALTSSIFVTGGPVSSTTTQIFVITPLLAFAVSGRKVGVIWTVIVFLTYTFLILLDVSGFQFVQVMALDYLYVHHMIDWLIGYVAIIGLVMVYESTNARLKIEKNKEHEQYVYLANHDTLTGLANRNYFNNNLDEAIERAVRGGEQVALVYIDLNDFKPVNDSYGHETGDRVLQVIAQRLKATVRKTDLAARIGGDEFAIILEDVKDSIDFQEVAIKLLSQIAAKIDCSHEVISVTGSIGIALYPTHTTDRDELWVMADIAMYHSKNTDNFWSLYSPDMPKVR